MAKYLVELFDKFTLVSSLDEQGKPQVTIWRDEGNTLYAILGAVSALVAIEENAASWDTLMRDGTMLELKTVGMALTATCERYMNEVVLDVGQNLSRGDKRWRTKTRGW